MDEATERMLTSYWGETNTDRCDITHCLVFDLLVDNTTTGQISGSLSHVFRLENFGTFLITANQIMYVGDIEATGERQCHY